MKKIIIINSLLFFCIISIYSQVGINTSTPQGWLHIDGHGDTVIDGSTVSNDTDNYVVDSEGNVGIGTSKPTNKLTIVASGNNTGLQILNDAGSGKLLATNSVGGALWTLSPKHLFTYLSTIGGYITVSTTRTEPYTKMTTFSATLDQVKQTYGSNYGWDAANSQFKVPSTGIYRIVINGYFNSSAVGRTPRIYAYLNNEQSPLCGLLSVTDPEGDICGYTMTIVNLQKDDILDFRIGSQSLYGNNIVKYYAGAGHTYAYIEAL